MLLAKGSALIQQLAAGGRWQDLSCGPQIWRLYLRLNLPLERGGFASRLCDLRDGLMASEGIAARQDPWLCCEITSVLSPALGMPH